MRSGCEALRGEVGRGRGEGRERGEHGEGIYVFLQRMDTQKMPAARKQADMVR